MFDIVITKTRRKTGNKDKIGPGLTYSPFIDGQDNGASIPNII
jgi:hypothetical protein